MASVVVPLAYPFPHLGKTLSFVFVSFAAWYVGQNLTASQTATMATTGAVSSFASPLVSIPYLLDQYQIPQDVMPLFILPGFITMRLADVVGVMSLMALTLVVTQMLRAPIRIRWMRLLSGVLVARISDQEWLRFLDGWVEFERVDGTLESLGDYWIQGGGTKKRPPRWCVVRDVLHWLP